MKKQDAAVKLTLVIGVIAFYFCWVISRSLATVWMILVTVVIVIFALKFFLAFITRD